MARPPRSGWRVRRKAAGIRSVTSCSIWGARTRIPFGDVARAPVTSGWDIVTIAPAVLDRMARRHAVAVGVPNSSPARRLGLVQCLVSPGGSSAVRATTCSTTAAGSSGLRPGGFCRAATRRALAHEPFLPAPHDGFGAPVPRMIALVPSPSAVSKRMFARQT